MSAFGNAFGQQSSGFSGPSNSAFGASAFGQSSQPPAFGASAAFGGNATGGLFGQSASQQQSGFGAFGKASNPFGASGTFGASAAQSAPAFGASNAFGQSAFGAQNTSGFGAAAQGGFGASSQSAFGSAAFGAANPPNSLFGSARPPSGAGFGSSAGAFGQSQSAWGAAASSAAFGAQSGTGGLFGNNNSNANTLFGNQNSAFGGNNNQSRGTSGTNWQETVEYDGNPTTSLKYQVITMMQPFRDKSLEELRAEDYLIGNKSGNAGGAGGGGLFGQQNAPSTGLFGSNSAGFGQSSSGFGVTNAFGAQQNQGGGFGASSGGSLFGDNSGFGNTSAFGQSTGGFGSGSGSGFGAAQSGGGLFGQSAPASGFGAQQGGGFGAGASGFGNGAAGFGSGAGGFGSGAAGFGNTGNAFGASGSGFGGGAGFGNTGFPAANPQSAGTGLFAQTGAANAFGVQQSQPLFGAPVQSGGGLFPNATSASGFGGAGAGQSSSIFGGGAQNNLFGGASAAGAGNNSLFGANAGNQPAGFGPAAPTDGFGFGAAASGGGTFNGNTGFGQTAPNAGFGFGGGMGAQPNQMQGGQFGNYGAAGQNMPMGQGMHPSLQNTVVAVTQGYGGTVAPPGANYGTVLHNLQKLQGEMAEQKRLMEQQARQNAQNTQQPGALSVVVLTPPSLVKLSANSWSVTGGTFGPARTPHRTKMRSVVGRIGGATNRISGTPVKTPGASGKVEDIMGTSSSANTSAQKMPFFSPEQFTPSKRRSLRTAEITTPHRRPPVLLPIPDSSGNTNGLKHNSSGKLKRKQPRSTKKSPASIPGPDDNSSDDEGSIENANGNHEDELTTAGIVTPAAGSKSAEKQGSRHQTPTANFMWSSPRPSAWSLKTPVDSVDQYDPEKYLPYLTKEGFYTVPTMAELGSRTMKELQAVVGFTVGREGYGEITWVESVDVRGLDLDAAVDIQKGEIAVFPDQDASQLDAPAIVTLERMHKIDKETGTPTTDEALMAKYAKKLKVFCEQSKLRFMSYDGDQGRWQFRAETFAES